MKVKRTKKVSELLDILRKLNPNAEVLLSFHPADRLGEVIWYDFEVDCTDEDTITLFTTDVVME